VTNGQPLIKPSYDAQDHARGSERYHTSEGVQRGLDRVTARARTAPILLPLDPRWVQKTRQGITSVMVVQASASDTGRDGPLTNRSDFDRFTTLVGSPKAEDVRVQIAFA
jgi:hypothetical protein